MRFSVHIELTTDKAEPEPEPQRETAFTTSVEQGPDDWRLPELHIGFRQENS